MIQLVAPAKLTWFLEVTGRRADGFHELRSEMVTLEFADHLEVDPDGDFLRVEPPTMNIPSDDGNLVVRALQLVGRRAGVTLHKSIPAGGGLGGGSADAGAILRWAGGVPDDVAVTLGGDVPFCQHGGRALVEGIGETITPLPYEYRSVTLFMPDFSINTGACYQAFDEMGGVGAGRNHLEPAARIVEPRLARTLDWLRGEYGPEVQLAGSGSTMFLEGHLSREQMSWDVLGPDGTLRIHQTATTPR